MKISNETYNKLVNKVISAKKETPATDTIQIIEGTLKDYELHLKELSDDEKSDLKFQLTYSLVNHLREQEQQ